jgi:hypothetical protein
MIEYKTYNYSNRINSYIPLNRDNVYSMQTNDLYLYFDGNIIDEHTHDSEIRDDSVVSVKKVKK